MCKANIYQANVGMNKDLILSEHDDKIHIYSNNTNFISFCWLYKRRRL